MLATTISKFAASGSVVGAIALVVACASSEREPTGASSSTGSGGRGGAGGSGGAGKSTGAGSGGTGGTTAAGSGGIAGSGCTYSDAVLSAGAPARASAGAGPGSDAGGAGGETAGVFECIPGNVYACFTPPVAAPGMPFVRGAWAFGGAANVDTAEVRSPERGTVCISGSNPQGGDLTLAVVQADGPAPFTQLASGIQDDPTPAELFHARWLEITDVSFKLEPPPGLAVAFSIATAAPCTDEPVRGSPENDGNPFLITTGETTTVSLADFVSENPLYPFDTNAILQLDFVVGNGPYDFCVSDLKFLDAHGDEVLP